MKRLLPVILLSLLFASCRHRVGPTVVAVENPIHYYYPVLQGEDMELVWQLTNKGPEPLIVQDILPPCAAITLKGSFPSIIPVGDSVFIAFNFNTSSNIGPTMHTICLYGNIEPDGVLPLRFGVNLVRPTLQHTDYEEQFFLLNGLKHEIDKRTRSSLYVPVDTMRYLAGGIYIHERDRYTALSTDSLMISLAE